MKRVWILLIFYLVITIAATAQVINLRKLWRFHIGDNAAWASPEFNDSRWEFMQVPAAWEDEGYNGYDGFAWYRIKFDGQKLDKQITYYLNLGFIDDADEAYLNGKLIGFSGVCPPKFKTAYNNERRYSLPGDDINYKGENTIAVRVFDAMQGGGIVDGQIGIYPIDETKNLLLDLQGIWSFAMTRETEPIKNEKDWQNIMVPSPWEFQGYARYDGYAWYKRTFTLPSNFTKEKLVLILGRIDDFDKVYLNGKLIGSTNDKKPYGESHSFEVKRVYNIPEQALKRNGTNVLEVFVEDTGNIGGIYEGPIGITTKINYEKYFKDDF